ncbi:MAG: hypothetical protein AAGL89_10795 [Pseudomonadota bacterium]
MAKSVYEGRAYPTDLRIPLPNGKELILGDHTWVKVHGKGDFVCWGGKNGKGDRSIVSGKKGHYAVSNCYRTKTKKHKDTAGFAYAVNGVCHQAANLYMRPARQKMTLKVRGYYASLAAFGAYGNTAPFAGVGGQLAFRAYWDLRYWNKCKRKTMMALGADDEPDDTPVDPVFEALAALHGGEDAPADAAAANAAQRNELAIIMELSDVRADYGQIEDLHVELQESRDEALGAGLTGLDLATAINTRVADFQVACANRLDGDMMMELNGTTAEDPVAIVDPRIAEDTADQEVVTDYTTPPDDQ